MSEKVATVLVVDDQQINLSLYRIALQRLPGVTVLEAQSGLAALEILAGRDVDLVLLDLMMPEMDGFAVAHEIFARKGEAAPPIIFITAMDDREATRRQGYEIGGLDFIYKPIDMKVLQYKVAGLLKLQRQRVEVEEKLATIVRERSEIESLLAAAKEVVTYRDFPTVARKIFDRCKAHVGAQAGYVSLLGKDGKENELLFLDAGGLPCAVDPKLPMPLRGLREVAYREKRVVSDNAFRDGPWAAMLPAGHAMLDNVLFAPLVVEGKAVGLVGLANKPGGFDGDDRRVASAFGELAALALHNAQTLDALNRVKRLMEQAGAISRMGSFEWNRATGEMLWTSGLFDILGLFGETDAATLDDFLACVHAQDREKVQAALENVHAARDTAEVEFRGSGSKEGKIFLFQACSRPLSEYEDIVMGACQDISPIKEMEARAMHQQKLDAIGQLAGGLAHEINTPLQYVVGNMEFIGKMIEEMQGVGHAGSEDASAHGAVPASFLESASALQEALRDCSDGLQRIQATIHSMIRFSQSEAAGQSHSDVNGLVADVVSISRNAWEDVAEVTLDLAADLPEPLYVPGEVSVCLLNLVLNAGDAIRGKVREPGDRGNITVGTRWEDGWLHIWVADTGTGIEESIRSRLFDPFFTTREVGKGTGMGLALASAAVHRHGGELRFDTTPGEGTTFHIRLPLGLA